MEITGMVSCGTTVETKIGKHVAIITAACIRFDKVQYELSYFYNGDYKTVWLHRAEFDLRETDQIKSAIGFQFERVKSGAFTKSILGCPPYEHA